MQYVLIVLIYPSDAFIEDIAADSSTMDHADRKDLVMRQKSILYS
jgi:hypothetical protein